MLYSISKYKFLPNGNRVDGFVVTELVIFTMKKLQCINKTNQLFTIAKLFINKLIHEIESN